ncbi:ABC transporter ATP-binding protein [Ornithinibacillus halophilus]|uniref:Iron complex transport system ATP-binding protein n=1 Tax=Ornithinibacillus halophilus TaxID=930117 RepID=A0A1M5KG79_9BACI|nr:ABC transporter ATP-binding protein [Ornithinibacillus halophilus]SHG51737.1 iron complex transport system ATP-binding protein [Ornithinibacillus halophilus]
MEINDITFAYQDKITRLHKVNAQLKKGEITTIIGPNGCGKSTLLSVLTNNNQPQAGQVILDGKVLNKYKPKELAKKLGVVHQQNTAPADMTVEKLVHYGRLPHKNTFSPQSEKDEQMVEWALKCTGLYERRHDAIDTLSGGQQQRVWIAMALAQDTPFLFLDEPTSNLDMYYQYEILELVKQLCEEHGLTIVMVLHDINQAIQYSHTIIAMKQGKVIETGNPKEIVTRELIQEVYGVNVVVKDDEDVGMYIVPLGI